MAWKSQSILEQRALGEPEWLGQMYEEEEAAKLFDWLAAYLGDDAIEASRYLPIDVMSVC